MKTPHPRTPAPPPPSRIPRFLLVAGLGAGAALFLVLRAPARNRGDGDIGARLGDIEQRLEALEATRSGRALPVFLAAPGDADERASVTEAVAALSAELERLRAQIESGELGPDAFTQIESPDPGERRRGIGRLLALAKQKDPQARAALRGLLRDGDARVRRQSLEALESLEDPALMGDVMPLLGDGDERVRGQAARTLADMAENATDPASRAHASQALTAMLNDPKARVREDVVRGLADLGGQEAVPGLLQALGDGRADVQGRAIEALGEIGDPAALAALRQSYGDGSGPNALSSALAMRRLGDEQAFTREAARLQTLATSSASPDERRDALRTLARNAPDQSRALLEQALRDPSDRVRREAQRELERLQR